MSATTQVNYVTHLHMHPVFPENMRTEAGRGRHGNDRERWSDRGGSCKNDQGEPKLEQIILDSMYYLYISIFLRERGNDGNDRNDDKKVSMEKKKPQKKIEDENILRPFHHFTDPHRYHRSPPIPHKGHVRYARTVRKVSEDHSRGPITVR